MVLLRARLALEGPPGATAKVTLGCLSQLDDGLLGYLVHEGSGASARWSGLRAIHPVVLEKTIHLGSLDFDSDEAMADANLQTLAQLGTLTSTAPVVVTQTVPLVNAGLPVVRAYRDAMVRYYDEPPTPQSLAGFIGARYAITVLQGLDAAPTRQNVLAACQRRNPLDLGGFQVRFDGNKRSGHYVTQSMLSPDGRVVG